MPRAGDDSWLPWELFDLNGEGNPPAVYSTLLWIGAAGLSVRLAAIDSGTDGVVSNRAFWLLIAGVSLLLGMDEGFVIHERIGAMLDVYIPHFPVYDWLIPGVAVMVIVGVSLMGFVLRLPSRTRWMILLSAAIFVFGAVIMESLGAMVENGVIKHFPLGLDWPLETGIEEFCEMAGVILFLHALQAHGRTLSAAIASRG